MTLATLGGIQGYNTIQVIFNHVTRSGAELGSALHTELGEGALQVVLHCANRHHQVLRDLAVAAPALREKDDLVLAFGEVGFGNRA
jgi:hypothetical protein